MIRWQVTPTYGVQDLPEQGNEMRMKIHNGLHRLHGFSEPLIDIMFADYAEKS